MIRAVLIFNNSGKSRLSKFYTAIDSASQQALIEDIFQLVSKRGDQVCNFLETSQIRGESSTSRDADDDGVDENKVESRVIYRHYATLFFVFLVDRAESELAILDLIQVFVESLDRVFENVCELDLIFHFDAAHHLLDEIISAGIVIETNIQAITRQVLEAKKLDPEGSGWGKKGGAEGPLAAGLSTLGSLGGFSGGKSALRAGLSTLRGF